VEKHITPEALQRYDPVLEGRFQRTLGIRLVAPILDWAQGSRDGDFAIHSKADGRIVARAGHTIPTWGKGVNNLRARLDPAHAELAPYLVGALLHEVTTLSPKHRIEFSIPQWMEAVVAEAEEAGFTRRLEYLWMGMEL
jgi:hypothetical protein